MDPPTCGQRLDTKDPDPQSDAPSASRATQGDGGTGDVQGPSSGAVQASAAGALQEPHKLRCWACHILLNVPRVGVEQRPAPYFMCGWCHAMIDTFPKPRKPRGMSPFAVIMRMLNYIGWGVPAVVALLICSIVAPCVIMLIWIVPNFWALVAVQMFSWMAIFQVFYHFAACIFLSPGTVKELFSLPKKGESIPQGCFKDMVHCRHCDHPRPPPAYHCHSCKACVVDLDHHCPFINNCVGRSNRRHFLLFLIWVLVALLIAAVDCLVYFYVERQALLAVASAVWESFLRNWTSIFYMVVLKGMKLPWLTLGALWAYCATVVVYVGVCSLLWLQLQYFAEESAEESFKARSAGQTDFPLYQYPSGMLWFVNPSVMKGAIAGLRKALSADTHHGRGSIVLACLRLHLGPVNSPPLKKMSRD